MAQIDKFQRWTGALLLLAVAILYLVTLDNGLRPDELTGGDLITHQYAQVEARPSNAPGYPLYTMGGWLWFRLGQALLGGLLNPIQILSSYSMLWGLASLLMLYLILHYVGGRRWWLPPLLTAFYAVTFFFWYYSVTTEQYTSAVFQTLLLIWLAFRWDEQPRDSTLLGMAFVSGTMLANMVTTLFILPPLLWFIFARRSDKQSLMLLTYLKRPKLVLQAVGLALLPLLSYAYIYIRGAQHPEWRGAGDWPSTWAWFIQFLTIQQGRDELAPGLALQNMFTAEFPALIWQELTWPVFIGGLLGLACLGRRRAIFLYATLLIYLFFSWGYRFGNWFQVIIPAYPIFIIGFAAGIIAVAERLQRAFVTRPSSPTVHSSFFILHSSSFILHCSFFIILTGLLIYRLITNLPAATQRNLPTDTGLDPGWAILADRPRSPARIAVDFEERVALQYLHTVWGVVPQIEPVTGDGVDGPGAAQKDVPLYVSRRAATMPPDILLDEAIYPQAAGVQLIHLTGETRAELPASAERLDLQFGDRLRLVGWDPLPADYPLPEAVARRGIRPNWQIALYWQTSEPLTVDYTISVRPLVEGQIIDRAGEPLIQDHQPVWGLYPTSRWPTGHLVRDVYALDLPAGVTPTTLQIVVYYPTAGGFENVGLQTIPFDPVRHP